MNKQLAYQYQNGNYTTSIYTDGTKIRENELDHLDASFPDSMDLKITNWCDMGDICKYCHEASHLKGRHADLTKTIDILSTLPGGQEIAIGGGHPFAHPEFEYFLTRLKDINLIANVTVNELHLTPELVKTIKEYLDQGLIKGLGISYRAVNQNHDGLIELCNYNPNVVIHLIAGIDTVDDVTTLSELISTKKFLLLGYKDFRKGIVYRRNFNESVERNIKTWYNQLPVFVARITNQGGVVSFDNLAIEQLNVKRIFLGDSWNEFYQGTDGTHTMYIDGVEEKFALSSTCRIKYNYMNTIEDMFKKIKVTEN